jgi:hypothetical protein
VSSPLADRVIEEAISHGLAFLKVAQPNDLGITGGHQSGFHLSKQVAHVFTPQEPTKGVNHDHPVRIRWENGDTTDSVVKWYGRGTRSEYRLTSFNRIRSFYYLQAERLGSVLVLIQVDQDDWLGYMLETDDDIEAVLAALGLDLADATWALYAGSEPGPRDRPDPTECERREVEEFLARHCDFPKTTTVSAAAREAHRHCRPDVTGTDASLLSWLRIEFDLFQALERKLVLGQVQGGFSTVDEFVREANSVLQRRKARAGHSLENHVAATLLDAEVAFEAQPSLDGTKPDFVMPSKAAYDALGPDGGSEEVFVVAVKTTCKDRWRQVIQEGPRVDRKYLLTLQRGISSSQMKEMHDAGVQLVVPSALHADYAPVDRSRLMTVEAFVSLLPKGDADANLEASSLF